MRSGGVGIFFGGVELFAEAEALRLVIGAKFLPVQQIGNFGTAHQVQAEKRLPVFNKKRHIPTADFQDHSGGRCVPA